MLYFYLSANEICTGRGRRRRNNTCTGAPTPDANVSSSSKTLNATRTCSAASSGVYDRTNLYAVIRANKHVHATQLPLVRHANARERPGPVRCAADSVRLLGLTLTVHPSVQTVQLANVHSTIDDRPSSSGFESVGRTQSKSRVTAATLVRFALLCSIYHVLLLCLDR